eukprot:gene18111-24541_t
MELISNPNIPGSQSIRIEDIKLQYWFDGLLEGGLEVPDPSDSSANMQFKMYCSDLSPEIKLGCSALKWSFDKGLPNTKGANYVLNLGFYPGSGFLLPQLLTTDYSYVDSPVRNASSNSTSIVDSTSEPPDRQRVEQEIEQLDGIATSWMQRLKVFQGQEQQQDQEQGGRRRLEKSEGQQQQKQQQQGGVFPPWRRRLEKSEKRQLQQQQGGVFLPCRRRLQEDEEQQQQQQQQGDSFLPWRRRLQEDEEQQQQQGDIFLPWRRRLQEDEDQQQQQGPELGIVLREKVDNPGITGFINGELAWGVPPLAVPNKGEEAAAAPNGGRSYKGLCQILQDGSKKNLEHLFPSHQQFLWIGRSSVGANILLPLKIWRGKKYGTMRIMPALYWMRWRDKREKKIPTSQITSHTVDSASAM